MDNPPKFNIMYTIIIFNNVFMFSSDTLVTPPVISNIPFIKVTHKRLYILRLDKLRACLKQDRSQKHADKKNLFHISIPAS